MITIYHNPRCAKSRQGLEILKASGHPFTVVKYLEEPPDKKELEAILSKLDMAPVELVRKNEAVWKERYKGKTLSDAEVIEAMAAHPKLIERPIVINGSRAVVGRPPENIHSLL